MKYEVTELTLKGGARGLIVNVADAPVMSTQFQFHAGSRFVKDWRTKWETAHIMEHMAFGANDEFDTAAAYDAEFTKNGAYHNAFTSDNAMCYVATCADFEWDRILDLQRLAICRPKFTDDEFTSEYGNVKAELTGYLSQADWVLWPKLGQSFGEDTVTIAESLDLMPGITVDDIREHHRRTHTAGNLRFVIAGNFNGRMTKLKELLKKWELPAGERLPIPMEELHSFDPLVIRRKDVPSITLAWNMRLPRRLSDAENEAMDALNQILNGTLHSRIQGAARTRGLAYYVWSKTAVAEHRSSWEFGTEATADNLGKVIDLVVKELTKIQNGEITDAEIDEAKSYALGRHQMGIQTASQLNDWLASWYFFDGQIRDFTAEPQRIKAIARERIIDTAREFFAADCWGMGIYGNTGKATADILGEKLAKLFKKI
ncbi:MAG: insulinase family protein [Candidatus Nomurabacteria bacterium]|jgi:predicted Zn-dependent peptidase|nr:insulinase family protein [Candidatus Nomurabacteria bacterium]